jgi:hypothetical protein
MVKLLFFCTRRADISHERYADALLGRHAPIALRHHPTLRRYVINIIEGHPPDAPELDSIGELYFDSFDDFRLRLYDSAEGEQIVREDVAGFMAHADAYLVDEHILHDRVTPSDVGTRSPGLKRMTFVRRRAGLTRAGFSTAWQQRQAPPALAQEGLIHRHALGVVVRQLGSDAPDWDGSEDLRLVGEAAADRPPLVEDHARLVDRATTYRVAEYVQRA